MRYNLLTCFLLITSPVLLFAQQVYVSTIQLTSSLSLDGLIVSDDGILYGAEGYNGTKIFKINMDGTSEVFASNLNGPIDMDFDNEGNLYVTTFNNAGVYKITPVGVVSRYATVTTGPSGIVLNRQTRDVFVSHFGSAPFSGNSVYKIDSSGTATVFVQDAQLRSPVSLAIDNNSNLYTPNIGDSRLFKITQNGEMSLLATLPVSTAQFNIGHIAFANYKLYVTGNTGRHYLYKVELDGSYKIIAGTGVAGNQDGEGLNAQFNGPNGIAASTTGDTLFISELNSPSTIRVVSLGTMTRVQENAGEVREYKLMQNYPNPFNPQTTIKYQIIQSGNVSIKLFDVLGSEVAILVNAFKKEGNYEINLDASGFVSGIYFYQLRVNKFTQTKKMVLLR